MEGGKYYATFRCFILWMACRHVWMNIWPGTRRSPKWAKRWLGKKNLSQNHSPISILIKWCDWILTYRNRHWAHGLLTFASRKKFAPLPAYRIIKKIRVMHRRGKRLCNVMDGYLKMVWRNKTVEDDGCYLQVRWWSGWWGWFCHRTWHYLNTEPDSEHVFLIVELIRNCRIIWIFKSANVIIMMSVYRWHPIKFGFK